MRSDPRPDRRPDLDTGAIIEAYESGTSAASLSRQHHASLWSILNRLKKAGVKVRSSNEQNEKRLDLPKGRLAEFIGLVDGLILGDGSISARGSFSLEQVDTRRGWLEHVATQLTELGVDSRIIPRAAPRKLSYIDGRQINVHASSVLYTPCYAELKVQRARWYPNGGGKQVPADVTMTPLGLASWFCGDGSGDKQGLICFYTNSFTERDVRALAAKISLEFNVSARCAKIHRPPKHRTTRTESEFKVVVSKRDDAQRFKDLTEALMPECCLYKFQHVRRAIPRGSLGAKLSQEKADEIREKYSAGAVQTALATEYGVHQTAISAVVSGKTYRALEHVGTR